MNATSYVSERHCTYDRQTSSTEDRLKTDCLDKMSARKQETEMLIHPYCKTFNFMHTCN